MSNSKKPLTSLEWSDRTIARLNVAILLLGLVQAGLIGALLRDVFAGGCP